MKIQPTTQFTNVLVWHRPVIWKSATHYSRLAGKMEKY
ncbi:unnamed protein product [Soboliphyme baturini]|uniref:Uncharacterized protein n=1 Tax=Soboliphyme baturini TaxID=241478 RepID=A0A183IPT1_9BILA|nr:unnamed protein product [Soboliphyme baturini]